MITMPKNAESERSGVEPMNTDLALKPLHPLKAQKTASLVAPRRTRNGTPVVTWVT